MSETTPPRASVRGLVRGAIPALVIGIGSAVILKVVDLLSDGLNDVFWHGLPGLFGVTNATPWWIFTVLTITGALIGLVVWLIPGHAGFDSATTELDGPFPTMAALPTLFIVLVLALAGGVSLGPENPIITINAVLAMTVVGRFVTRMPAPLLALLAVAGTVGALFGTPVAAALLFTGIVGGTQLPGSLWDKLFLPLVAGGAGAVTMLLLGGQALSFTLPPMGHVEPIYLLTGLVVAAASALIGIAMSWVFPYLHRAFHALRNPLLFTLLGGAVLGVLGMIGGPLTLFKGAEQTIEIIQHRADYTPLQLAAVAGIKVLALLVAASAGFRGGRIFPAVFIGATLGLLGGALLPDLPIALAVACGVLGTVLAVAKDGWIALFIAIALVGEITVLSLLCIIILPVWLMVTKAPQMLILPATVRKEHAEENRA